MGGNPNFAGYVAGPLMNVQQSMFCNQRNQLLFLEYDTLVSDPYNSLQQIYEFLEEPISYNLKIRDINDIDTYITNIKVDNEFLNLFRLIVMIFIIILRKSNFLGEDEQSGVSFSGTIF
mgnify:CR=1 FL=1